MKALAVLSVIVTVHVAPLAEAFVGPKSVAPDAALSRLMQGNERFATGRSEHPRNGLAQIRESAKGQAPFASILSCADSRVAPELLFDQGLGDLFVVRTAGNTASPGLLGSLEFASAKLGSQLIVVVGHTSCGAVTAAESGDKLPGNLPSVIEPILPAVKAAKGHAHGNTVEENVRHTVKQIRASSQILADLEKAGKLKIVGATYDLATGKVVLLKQH